MRRIVESMLKTMLRSFAFLLLAVGALLLYSPLVLVTNVNPEAFLPSFAVAFAFGVLLFVLLREFVERGIQKISSFFNRASLKDTGMAPLTPAMAGPAESSALAITPTEREGAENQRPLVQNFGDTFYIQNNAPAGIVSDSTIGTTGNGPVHQYLEQPQASAPPPDAPIES